MKSQYRGIGIHIFDCVCLPLGPMTVEKFPPLRLVKSIDFKGFSGTNGC